MNRFRAEIRGANGPISDQDLAIRLTQECMARDKYLCMEHKDKNMIILNPQAVGRDSGVQLSLSNFLEDILQPTKSKMSQV